MAYRVPQRRSRPAETPEEMKARVEITKANAAVERYNSLMLHGASLTVILSISAVCVWVIVAPPTEHAFSWATGTLSSMVTGIVAYFYGRSAGQSARAEAVQPRSRS